VDPAALPVKRVIQKERVDPIAKRLLAGVAASHASLPPPLRYASVGRRFLAPLVGQGIPMKAIILSVMAVGAFAGGVGVAAVSPGHHAAARHHQHEECVVRHGERVCRMVR
jgi:hypothetical protein